MARLFALLGLLALTVGSNACAGYYQCKYSNGSHCCVRKPSTLN